MSFSLEVTMARHLSYFQLPMLDELEAKPKIRSSDQSAEGDLGEMVKLSFDAGRTPARALGLFALVAVAGLIGCSTSDNTSGGSPDVATAPYDAGASGTPDSTLPMQEGGPQPSTDSEAGSAADDSAPPGAGDDSAEASMGNPACAPTASTGPLPFAVDSQYVSSGFMGDAPAGDGGAATVTIVPVKMGDDVTCGGKRSSATAMGNCHVVTYTPLPVGTGLQWAGVFWQFPGNNWGATGGYAIPAGATKVSFWAKGDVGGEAVTFIFGYTGQPTSTLPCGPDPINATTDTTLMTSWHQYTIPIMFPYPGGMLGAFGWVIKNSSLGGDGGVGDGGSAAPANVKFYVDDIQWQQ